MHVLLLAVTLFGMVMIRQGLYHTLKDIHQQPLAQVWVWREYWYRALAAIVLPPLGLICAIIAIMVMGHHGAMFGMTVSAWGCWLSWGLIGAAGLLLLALLWRIYAMQQELKHYPRHPLAVPLPVTSRLHHHSRDDRPLAVQLPHPAQTQAQDPNSAHTQTQPLYGRVLSESSWFAGYIGLWQPELAIGQALRTQLSAEQLAGVIAHERGHAYYHDTWVFFVLGWLRRLTAWLPHTRSLWQILVLLREIRADRWASQFVDPLVLAETLVFVVRQTMQQAQQASMDLSCELARELDHELAYDRLPKPDLDWIGFHDQVTWADFQQRLDCLLLRAEWGSIEAEESVLSWGQARSAQSAHTVRSNAVSPTQPPLFLPAQLVQHSWTTFTWIAAMLIIALLPLVWIPFHHHPTGAMV